MARQNEIRRVEAPIGHKGLFARNILNREGTVIGYVNGRCIYDVDRKLWGTLPNGRSRNQASYIASSSGQYSLGYVDVNGNLFDGANRFIGTIQSRRKSVLVFPVLILLLAVICLSAYYSPYILKESVGIGVFNPEYPQISVVQESDKNSWSQVEQINMLNSDLGKKIIFPGATNKYYFVLSNDGEDNIKFNLDITEENPGMITMRYRVKMMNNYVLGGDGQWVTVDDLHLSNLDMRSESKTLFCIEWLWDTNVSDYNDTKVGNTAEYSKIGAEAYVINIAITSTINTMG